MEWIVVIIFSAAVGNGHPGVVSADYGTYQSQEDCEAVLVSQAREGETLIRNFNGDLVRSLKVTTSGSDLVHAQCLQIKRQ